LSVNSFIDDISGESKSVFEWDILGQPLFNMMMECWGYFLLVLVIERLTVSVWGEHLRACVGRMQNCCKRCCCAHEKGSDDVEVHDIKEDIDVAVERGRIDSGEAAEDPSTVLMCQNLRKAFPQAGGAKVAVDSNSFAVSKGMCFGLLGVNGAGKTTTFSMLTGETPPTSGDAFVNGYSIANQMPKVRQNIGYCPQFDALLDNMTGREHLRLFARTKGVAEEYIEMVAAKLIEHVNLSDFADKPSGTYSGGNKRKLSLAIALVGNPRVVLLDEPSTGMDPVSRRFMWDVIQETAKDRSVVLTTHSLDECEALCNKVVVMVGGKLKCIGSTQHLKTRFGEGYTAELKTTPEKAAATEEFVVKELHGTVTECHDAWFSINIPKDALTLAQIFRKIESSREALQLSDYSVSQTTLEQIFLRFAAGQKEETALAPGNPGTKKCQKNQRT